MSFEGMNLFNSGFQKAIETETKLLNSLIYQQ